MSLHPLIINEIVRSALLEDLGHGQDVTSSVVIPENAKAKMVMRARKEGRLAGADVAAACFKLADEGLDVKILSQDGTNLKEGQAILEVSGNARGILLGERTALNLISHMSGIASATARYVDIISGTRASIVCTRKTMPSIRSLQKYAVRMGGGANHRFGLDDAILIKDNHIAIAGGIDAALSAAIAKAGHMVKIEIEVDNLEQLKRVLEYKVDAVLLDNMPPETLREAVNMVDGRMLTDASGGITLESVRAVAETGVDLISIGALTHSVIALDIGLDME